MSLRYQPEFRFSIEQTGIVRSYMRISFCLEPEVYGNLDAVEELAALKSEK